MKLQQLIIIFLAIALPIILIVSLFVGLQVDTAVKKSKYNAALINAAHETVVAFQLNTVGDKYSSAADTKIRDIEASLNVFSSSLATSFGATGSSKSTMMSYVPALCFTLYDGYYIYTPTKTWDSNVFRHELKSYVYYSKQYTNYNRTRVLNINYSLDNYVAVYYYKGNEYESRAGYLEVEPNNKDEFLKNLDENAKKYYNEAWEFTKWFNTVVKEIENDPENGNIADILQITRTNGNSALPKAETAFNSEKYDVIKNSITNNLIQAMYIYGRNADRDFQMPELTGDDWNIILNNTCFIAFMQGIPVGTTVYNDYTIAVSTENKESVSENTIYYMGEDGSYHRAWCPELKGDKIIRLQQNQI